MLSVQIVGGIGFGNVVTIRHNAPHGPAQNEPTGDCFK
jgi:hypothetical protein